MTEKDKKVWDILEEVELSRRSKVSTSEKEPMSKPSPIVVRELRFEPSPVVEPAAFTEQPQDSFESSESSEFRLEHRKDTRKKVKQISLNTFLALAIILLLSTLVMTLFFNREDTFLFGFKPYVIDSGSMEPEFKKNSVVIVKQVAYDSVQVGDVIAFKARQIGNRPAFHRVIEITDEGFTTKGDNVPIQDSQVVDEASFLGRKVWSTNATASIIPLLSTPRGIIYIIVFPILAIILLVILVKVIRNIWKNKSQAKSLG